MYKITFILICQALHLAKQKRSCPPIKKYTTYGYTTYGHVFQGMDVIDAIVSVPTDSIDEPLHKIMMDVNVIKMTKKEIEEKGFRVRE